MINSNQIAGVISAQQAAAYNQGVVSQAIGVTSGLAPGHLQPMQAANPAAMAPAIVGGVQSAASVAGIASAFGIGGAGVAALGSVDPFMAATRGWSAFRGTHAIGALQKGTWAARAAGMGASLGGGFGAGVAGAALYAAGPMAGFAAASYAANQMYQGGRERQVMGAFSGANFQHTNASGRQGFSNPAIGEMTRAARDVATEMGTSFDNVMGTLQGLTDMRLLDTVRNAKDFKRKMTTLLESVETVTEVLGVTMKDASGFMGSVRLAGMSSQGAVAQSALQRRVFASEGFTGEEFTNVQRFGGATAHRFGARRGHGARLATRMTTDVGRAHRAGIFSDAELVEATGMEGKEGYLAMAQVGTQAAFQFAQGPMGTAMLSYAGEMEDGRYTGRIDKGRLNAAMSGQVSSRDIARLGRERMGTDRETIASFSASRKRMAGNLAEQGGHEMIGAMVRSIAGERYGEMGKDDVASLLMDTFTGLDQTQAELLVRMSDEMTTISRQRRMDERAEMNKAIQDVERGLKSWRGAKRSVREGWRSGVSDPLRQMGTVAAGSWAQQKEDVGDWWHDRARTETLSDSRLERIALGMEKPGTVSHFGRTIETSDMSTTAQENLTVAGKGMLSKANAVLTLGLGKDLLDPRVGMTMTGGGQRMTQARVMEQEGLEQRRARGTLRARDVNMSGYQGDMTAVAEQILQATPSGMDWQDSGAVEKARGRVLRKGTLRDNDELRAAMSQSLGISEQDLLSGGLSRTQKAKVSDFIRYAMAEGGGTGGLAGESKYMTGALAAETAKDYKGAVENMFSLGKFGGLDNVRAGIGFGRKNSALQSMLKDDPAGRDTLFKLMEEGAKGGKGTGKDDLHDLETYVGALRSGSTEILKDPKYDKFRAFSIDEADAAIQVLKNTQSLALGGHNKLLKDSIQDLLAGSRGQRDAEAQQVLQGRGDAMMEGTDFKGLKSDVRDAVKSYAKGLGSGSDLYSNSGVEDARKVRTSLSGLSKRDRLEQREIISASEGGAILLKQVDMLDKVDGLAGATSVEDAAKALGVELTDVNRELLKSYLGGEGDKTPGEIDASEADDIAGKFAQSLGVVEALGKSGGVVNKSTHGSSEQLAAQMSDTEIIHAQFAATTRDAIEKIAKVTGISPAAAPTKSISP